MTDELRRALDGAYEVFAGYDAPRDLVYAHGVPHWPRNLSIEDWYQLEADNDITVRFYESGAEMLRHFLPRWLEWLSEDKARSGLNYYRHWGLYNLKAHLNHANWQTWPALEIAALRAVFLAWTREDVTNYGGEPSFDFLIGIGKDLAPHLELWLAANLPSVAQWLWTVNWNDAKGAQDWVASSRLESELEAAFFADPDGPNAELFSRSVELVRSLRAL